MSGRRKNQNESTPSADDFARARAAIAAAASAEHQERFDALERAHGMATRVFGTASFNVVEALTNMIVDGAQPTALEPILGKAKDLTGKLGSADADAVIHVLDIILFDEEAEEHLLRAKAKADKLFPGSTAAPFEVYSLVYGDPSDEDDEDDGDDE